MMHKAAWMLGLCCVLPVLAQQSPNDIEMLKKYAGTWAVDCAMRLLAPTMNDANEPFARPMRAGGAVSSAIGVARGGVAGCGFASGAEASSRGGRVRYCTGPAAAAI